MPKKYSPRATQRKIVSNGVLLMQQIKKLLLSVSLCVICLYQVKSIDVIEQGLDVFTEACGQLKAQPLSLSDRMKIAQANRKVSASEGTAFTEEELIAAMDGMLEIVDHKLTPEMKAKVNASMEDLAKHLAKFKVTGFAMAVDPNIALIFDMQNPAFNVVFKNSDGEIKTKRFQANIKSIGTKIQFSLNWNFIFFIGTDFNYLGAHEVIQLGVGGEVSLGSLIRIIFPEFAQSVDHQFKVTRVADVSIAYAPLKEQAGGLLMISGCG